MRTRRLFFLSAILLAPLTVSAAPSDWLGVAAGSLGYDRCEPLLGEIAREGIAGRPVGKNLESARRLPDKQFLGGFVEAHSGEQSRHHTFTVGENQNFLCEGRLVTSYVEPEGCDRFIAQYLKEARRLGDMADGRTRVFENSPYQLYVTETRGTQACLVTGVRRFGVTDARSSCAYSDIGHATAELCLLFRGNRGPMLSLKLDEQPVLLLREDLTDDFRLSHPVRGGEKGERVVIAGKCRPEYQDEGLVARVCTLSWGDREVFSKVRLTGVE